MSYRIAVRYDITFFIFGAFRLQISKVLFSKILQTFNEFILQYFRVVLKMINGEWLII